MELDITTKVAELMFGDDKNLPGKLREQEEKLKKLKCKNLKVGKWLEEFEMPVLLEIFNSSDAYFFESFPEMRSFNRAKRQAFAKEIQEHGKTCQRCSVKIFNDLEWEKSVEKSIGRHRGDLKEILENQHEDSEIDHDIEETVNA